MNLSPESKPLTVGLGEVLWDLLPGGKQLGGAPANFAYHTRILGARGCVASAVGDDPLGQELLRILATHGLSSEYVAVDAAHPTGTVSVRLDDAGKPAYTIHEGVAWDFMPQTAQLLDLAGRADAVCFGSLAQRGPCSRCTIRGFLEATRPECLRVFDINLRQTFFDRDVIAESLRLSRVFKLNDEELPVVADLLSLAGAEDQLLVCLIERYDLDVIALTRGAHGSTLASARKRVDHPGVPPAAIADTVGAGDAFTAATVMGLLDGRDLTLVSEHANRLASYVCTQNGAMPSVPADLLAAT